MYSELRLIGPPRDGVVLLSGAIPNLRLVLLSVAQLSGIHCTNYIQYT